MQQSMESVLLRLTQAHVRKHIILTFLHSANLSNSSIRGHLINILHEYFSILFHLSSSHLLEPHHQTILSTPGGCNIEGEEDGWDFGTGAGFYVDATEEKWKNNYRMYSYVTKEVISAEVLFKEPLFNETKPSICCEDF